MLYNENSNIMQDKKDFASWQAKTHQSESEYELRKRKAELYKLVRLVIKNELDKTQQEIVRLHWYEEIPLGEIADMMNISRATVYRKVQKINEIIYDKLKYAIEYRFGTSFLDDTAIIIKEKVPVCFPGDDLEISHRLRNLRLLQSFSESDVFEATGIEISRIKQLEQGTGTVTAEELKKLALFFKTSSDYILFGNNLNKKQVVQ